jgi:hypothetical protein
MGDGPFKALTGDPIKARALTRATDAKILLHPVKDVQSD